MTLLYHSWFSDCVTQDDRVTHVIVQNKAGRVAYEGKVFIDCTGDADLVRAAGFETVKGDVLQPASLWFQLGGVDTDALEYLFGDAVDGMLPVSAVIRDRLTELHEQGEIPIFGGPWINRFFHDGMVSINLLREATDASDPEWFTRTECSLRETLHLIIDVLRRELPRVPGLLAREVRHPDRGARDVPHRRRVHAAARTTSSRPRRSRTRSPRAPTSSTSTPRTATSRTTGDPAAGVQRAVPVPGARGAASTSSRLGGASSADGPGFGSVRVMATCMAMGQGAGTAAALSMRARLQHVRRWTSTLLRATLEQQGAVVDFDNTVNRRGSRRA